MLYNEIKKIAKTMSKEDFIKKYCDGTSENIIINTEILSCPDSIKDIENSIAKAFFKVCNDNCFDCWSRFIDKLYEDIKNDNKFYSNTNQEHLQKSINQLNKLDDKSIVKEIEEREKNDSGKRHTLEEVREKRKKLNETKKIECNIKYKGEIPNHDSSSMNYMIDCLNQALKSKDTYTTEELIYAIKTGNLKDNIQFKDNRDILWSVKEIKETMVKILLEYEPFTQIYLKLSKKYFIGDIELKENMQLKIQDEDPYDNKFQHIVTVKSNKNKFYLEDNNTKKQFQLNDDFDILEIVKE